MSDQELQILKLKAQVYDLSMKANNYRNQIAAIEQHITVVNKEISTLIGEKANGVS